MKNTMIIFGILFMVFIVSCDSLEEVNINPNGGDPADTHPNLLMSTIITMTGETVVDLGFGDIAGVMQHTQKDGWSGTHNAYDWTDHSWSAYYGILRNIDEFQNKTEEMELEFHEGVALIMKSYVFGLITDLWGDAPYSAALNGEEGGEENLKPVFDSQEDIYKGILADLEQANILLSKDQDEYKDISSTQDVLYDGNVLQWQKFANSLALRYYMRLSAKDPSFAKAGIEKMTASPEQYPLIVEAGDDANVIYYGTSSVDSWPGNTVFDSSSGSNYRRKKMCSTLVEAMQSLDDPRLELWANKIEIPLVIDPTRPDDYDEIVNGKRYVAQNIADNYETLYSYPLDTDPEYVGLPPAWSTVPQAYNLCPNLEQAPSNPHASHLNDIYKNASGPLLKARLLSAAEVHFILSEAALKGWTIGGSAAEHYEAGIEASFKAWGISGKFDSYMEGSSSYMGTLEQIIKQKWIASWTAASEAWFDYRRTGYPVLTAGPYSKREVLPIRFYYSLDEIDYNPVNSEAAIQKLVETEYTSPDGKNSAWSRMWVVQGTEKPW